MISRLGLAISKVFYRICPDPFVIAILLTLLTAVLALTLGNFPADAQGPRARVVTLLDAWRADSGIWKLLAFGMQMCLILVTGHALAATKPVRSAVVSLASTPKSCAGGAVLVCIVACLTGLVNWGLGLIVGAIIAREVGRSLTRRGIRVHYPLLAAAGYMGLLIFHGGLSGSAPLSATTIAGARKVLPESAIGLIGDGIPLDRTLFSPLNLFVTGGMLILLPALFWLLTPRRESDMQPMPQAIKSTSIPDEFTQAKTPAPSDNCTSIPERLDRSTFVVLILALALIAAWIRYVAKNGIGNIQINEINAIMFAAGLILHGSPRAYMTAVENGARDCGAIIIQFPIYAGIMALMDASGMVTAITQRFVAIGSAETLPVFSFSAATIVGLFVPSGGAQWSLQGPIALQSGAALGVDPGRMLMSVAYGDELANMLQPFWALPLLAITGVRAREIVGYTAIAMVVAGVWMAIGLLLF